MDARRRGAGDRTRATAPDASEGIAIHSFPRPVEPYLSVERRPADGACPECGAAELADYRVLGEGGWWDVRKCQRCLASISRTPAPRLGSFVPLGLTITSAQEHD